MGNGIDLEGVKDLLLQKILQRSKNDHSCRYIKKLLNRIHTNTQNALFLLTKIVFVVKFFIPFFLVVEKDAFDKNIC